MIKKIVHYEGEAVILDIGYCAFLKPTDHPNVSNQKVVKTTPVVAYDEQTGEIETLNTIYRRAQ